MAALGCAPGAPSAEERPLIFAAASLEDVLSEIAAGFRQVADVEPLFNFSGTNVLATQIVAAYGPDAFFSADSEWMDRVEAHGRLEPHSRRVVLGNRLVVVAHVRSPLRITAPAELATAEYTRLVLADPAAVPAGRYARAFLERVALAEGTLWERLEPRVVPAADVRAALRLVEIEPRLLGIVYRTDAMDPSAWSGRSVESRVRVLFEVPAELTPPIRYELAVLNRGRAPDAARRFLEYVTDESGLEIFERHGFQTGSLTEAHDTDG